MDISRIRIHPGIGMARLGNSDEFFIGPEAPGVIADPGGTISSDPSQKNYRDDQQRLKRQAQRFRIYGYDSNGNAVSELNINSADVESITWRVHVRNMKAANYAFQGAYLFDPTKYRNPSIQSDAANPIDRTDLIIDPGPKTISAESQQPLIMAGDVFTGVSEGYLPGYLRYCGFTPKDPSQPVKVTYTPATNIELGQLRLDDEQRLIFVPAPGKAECVTDPKIQLSNPSETYNPPNGPGDGTDPLINQFAYFNVPGWWDDTCGGEIDATVVLKNGTVLSTRDGVINPNDEGTRNGKNGGWIVTAPPKYAPNMYHVVSIMDRMYETFDSDPNQGQPTEFYRDIYPILANAGNYGWVSAEAAGVEPSTRNMAHGPKQAGNLLSPENIAKLTSKEASGLPARRQINGIMRKPEGSDSGPSVKFPTLLDTLPPAPPAPASPPRPVGEGPVSRGNQMPKLWGTGGKPLQNDQLGNNLPNQYLSLTKWQRIRLADWADNNFTVSPDGPIVPKPLDQYSIEDQPTAMDQAALQPTIGGGFHPGIEFPYLIAYKEYFDDLFRVKTGTEPGSVAAYMSSPWQGDYWSCNTAWWPVQRPEIVFSYDESSKTRTYKEWFRGYGPEGEPLSSTDGYNQMVYAWDKLGMVLPKLTGTNEYLTDNGSIVFQEYQRDPVLDKPPTKKTCS